MRFYQHLYMGEQAAGKRFDRFLQGLRERKIQPDIYVITLASGGNNIFLIYTAAWRSEGPGGKRRIPLLKELPQAMRRPASWQDRLSARFTRRPEALR